MIDAPPALCWFCGATAAASKSGLCLRCYQASRHPLVNCLNCAEYRPLRGRGLCGRCYQRLARTGQLPAPHRTTPEEVLGDA